MLQLDPILNCARILYHQNVDEKESLERDYHGNNYSLSKQSSSQRYGKQVLLSEHMVIWLNINVFYVVLRIVCCF